MKTTRSVSVAMWMLEHLAQGPYTEAIAGDLLEGVRRGKSAGWCWRQVLWAIGATWMAGLRARRERIGFAVMWGALWPVWSMVARTLLYWSVRGTMQMSLPARQIWMLAQAGLLNLTYLWIGLLVYLALDRVRWRDVPMRRFVRGWLACFWMFMAGKIVLSFGVWMLIWKMNAPGFPSIPYFQWVNWVGEPVIAAVSLVVAIGMMMPMREGRLRAAE